MDHTIKTFEDACQVKNLDPLKIIPDATVFPEPHQKALTAIAKLIVITDALNEDWKPDWQDNDQYKYYPWFDIEKDKNNPSGFRFGSVGYYFATSIVGSRLCFKNEELAQYAGEQFIDLYKDFMVI